MNQKAIVAITALGVKPDAYRVTYSPYLPERTAPVDAGLGKRLHDQRADEPGDHVEDEQDDQGSDEPWQPFEELIGEALGAVTDACGEEH
jgi:hypothetical protein